MTFEFEKLKCVHCGMAQNNKSHNTSVINAPCYFCNKKGGLYSISTQQMEHCLICQRETPKEYQEEHHLTPKVKGGKETITVCIDCGNQVHKLFSIQELKYDYNTLEKLLANEKISKWISWVNKKKEFGVCMKSKK